MVSAEEYAEHRRQVDAEVARMLEERSQSFWGWIDARPLPLRLLLVLTGVHIFFVLPGGLVLWFFASQVEDGGVGASVFAGTVSYLIVVGQFTWIAIAPAKAFAFLARDSVSYPLYMPGGVRAPASRRPGKRT